MEWLIVVMLVLVGAVLVLLEFLIFPGVNVAGIMGLGCIVAGVWCGYSFYGTTIGHFVLLGTGIFGFILTWYVLRSDTWKKWCLPAQLDGSVEGVDHSIRVGDLGITLGRLAPMGNVQIGEIVVEAESLSGYIDTRQEVEVVHVYKNKIVVQLKTS